AYLSGEPAEEVVENVPGVNAALIEEHEESAVAALAALEVLGALSLLSLFFSRKSASSAPALLVHGSLLLALVAFGLVAWTAHLGGQVHHPEIRAGAQWQAPEGGSEQGRSIPGEPGEQSGRRGEVEDEE
ncbi:MAG TPA: hypothetical protein VNN17_02975, partial [Terriglobia bacterium]|nr:hypothetical protein [Terriglobia bacterium]